MLWKLTKDLQISFVIAKLYQVLLFISILHVVHKGRSHQLLRKAVLKKEKEQKNLEELNKNEQLKSIPYLQKEIHDLKKELTDKDKELELYEKDAELLKELHRQGYIDDDGKFILQENLEF